MFIEKWLTESVGERLRERDREREREREDLSMVISSTVVPSVKKKRYDPMGYRSKLRNKHSHIDTCKQRSAVR